MDVMKLLRIVGISMCISFSSWICSALQVPGKDGGLDAIAFRQGKHLDLVRNGTFSLLYTLEENEWNGRRSLQLNVKDIKPGVGDPHGHGAARSEGPAFAAI